LERRLDETRDDAQLSRKGTLDAQLSYKERSTPLDFCAVDLPRRASGKMRDD
jgi:hypothetical protein